MTHETVDLAGHLLEHAAFRPCALQWSYAWLVSIAVTPASSGLALHKSASER